MVILNSHIGSSFDFIPSLANSAGHVMATWAPQEHLLIFDGRRTPSLSPLRPLIMDLLDPW